ncbi:enhancer of split mgamma protein-like [Thrips palmi]|uniref:Enhancer of split mgamma protein-like n=1 Tax=Thrips palmi TaxID=161013 RepID=A0A6P8XT77_THRPL|nr:enhancer of split mgamma protein-like [Thrips palmi]
MTAGEMLMMASLRDPYAAAAAGVGMLAASQLAQLNQLMMQQQQQQHAQQLQMQQSPLSPSQPTSSMHMGGPAMGTPLGTPLGMGSPPECQSPPISRTYTYKKVTKPLLERKRRARINRCLDELKELMVGALEAEGENVSKLEKADILELTVRHLQRITKPRDAAEDASRFQAGFSQCASEACHFLLGLPGLDEAVGRRLVAHLGQVVTQLQYQFRWPAVPTLALLLIELSQIWFHFLLYDQNC